MRSLSRTGGPAVVWVRFGNTTKQALISRFAATFDSVVEALERGETVIQIPND